METTDSNNDQDIDDAINEQKGQEIVRKLFVKLLFYPSPRLCCNILLYFKLALLAFLLSCCQDLILVGGVPLQTSGCGSSSSPNHSFQLP